MKLECPNCDSKRFVRVYDYYETVYNDFQEKMEGRIHRMCYECAICNTPANIREETQ